MDYITIRLAHIELAPLLTGAQVRDVISQGPRSVAFILWAGFEIPLIISAEPDSSRIHTLNYIPSRAANPDHHFHRQLRHHIAGAFINNVSLVNNERIIELNLSRREFSGEMRVYLFIAELMGRFSNLILTEPDGSIVTSDRTQIPKDNRGREIRPGKTYVRPQTADRIPLIEYDIHDFINFIRIDPANKPWSKLFLTSFLGITPGFISYMAQIANISQNLKTSDLDNSNIENLHKAYIKAISNLNNNQIIPPFSDLLTINPRSDLPLNNALADFYQKTISDKLSENRKLQWTKIIQSKIDSLHRLIDNLQNDLAKADNKDKYRRTADLIYANINLFKSGVTEIVVDDIYNQESSEKIILKLIDGKDAINTAKELHKRASKLARSEKEIQDRIDIAEKQLSEFQAILHPPNYVLELDSKAFDIVIKDFKSGKSKKHLKKGTTERLSGELPKKLRNENIHHYRTPDGTDIFVGGNEKANEAVYRWGNPDDYWLHVKNIPGSHVLIPRRDKIIDYDTILFAARLAVFHSRVKGATKVPVDYTLLKYVKKPPGSDPGYVTYSKEKNVLVDSLDELTEKKRKISFHS